MSSIRLDGKVALITGATKGIGRALTLALASAGASVVGTARNGGKAATDLAEQAKQVGGSFTFVQADVSRWDDCQNSVSVALEKFAHVDILVNNAGTSLPAAKMENLEEAGWRAVTSVTLDGTVFMSRAVLPAMLKQKDGVILNVASHAGVTAFAQLAAYGAAKAAVIHVAKVIAVENVGRGVRANALVVGTVETELLYNTLLARGREIHGPHWNPAVEENRVGDGGVLGVTVMKPEALAEVITLLCSDGAREITGSVIAIDRGTSAGYYDSTLVELATAGRIRSA